jgi:hypothetical protein
VDGFLVEPQIQGRAGTTWEPSHEWRLAEATPSSRGFLWFTRKPLGSFIDPQSQDRRTEDGATTVPDRSDLLGYMEATENLKYPFLTARDTSPSTAVLEVFKLSPSDGCPATATCLASTQAFDPDARPTGQTGLALLQHHLRLFGLGFVDQPRNLVVFW